LKEDVEVPHVADTTWQKKVPDEPFAPPLGLTFIVALVKGPFGIIALVTLSTTSKP
jgi:hypothetical protein